MAAVILLCRSSAQKITSQGQCFKKCSVNSLRSSLANSRIKLLKNIKYIQKNCKFVAFDFETKIYFMLVNAANITEKKYQKLTIQVSLNGMSFCTSDTLNHKILAVAQIEFDTTNPSFKIEDTITQQLNDNPILKERYDEVAVLYDNQLSTFVPEPLFDESYMGSYLQYNTKVYENDFFDFDTLTIAPIHNVFVPYVNINNIFIDHFGTFTYKHVASVLVSRLLERSKNIDDKKMFVHIASGHFEIVVVQNQHLLLFNTFEYKAPEDLIYYLLFTAEQLNLNPEIFKLEFLGNISEDDAYFKMAYKYIRNVSVLDVKDLQENNSLTTSENLKHFILLQS